MIDTFKCPSCGQIKSIDKKQKATKRRAICVECNKKRLKAERLVRIRLAQAKVAG